MKKYYQRFRVFLMALALGLASVFVMNGSLQFSDEVPVNLPNTESGEMLVIFPRIANQRYCFGHQCTGGNYFEK